MRLFRVLLVENSDEDALWVDQAIDPIKTEVMLLRVENGREALEYLQGQQLPELIIMAMDLPGMRGLELLRWLREHERARQVPIMVLGAAGQTTEAEEAYLLGASAYLIKPPEHDVLKEFVLRAKQQSEEPEYKPPYAAGETDLA
jgi:CheY-like chemotaxis protein